MTPQRLLIVKVIPAYKKGDACMASNYRPISLVSVFDKLFEKVMYNRLYQHWNIIIFCINISLVFKKIMVLIYHCLIMVLEA